MTNMSWAILVLGALGISVCSHALLFSPERWWLPIVVGITCGGLWGYVVSTLSRKFSR